MVGTLFARLHGAEPPPFTVQVADDLRRLPPAGALLHPFRMPRVRVRLAQLDDSEARAWESRLETLRQDCGCSAGAAGLCAFTLLAVALALRNTSPAPGDLRPGGFLVQGGALAAGLVLSALLGKLAGLALASLRFRRACARLERRARGLQAPGESTSA
jgi:hypothetical protein